MAIFELVIGLAGSRALTLSVGSFTISSGSIVIVFIPAVVSYLYLQVMYDTRQLQGLQREFVDMFHTWSQPKGGRDPLALRMFSSSFLGSLARLGGGFRSLAEYAFYTGIVIGALAFEVAAYRQLYNKHLTHGIPWVISLCVSVFFSIVAVGSFRGWDGG